MTLRQKLLSVACFHRREFFKLWNQLHDSDWVLASWEEKIGQIFQQWPHEFRSPKIDSWVRFLCPLDADYPQDFKELHQPPVGLFVWGEWPQDRPWVSVVGSRKPTSYAQRMCRRISLEWLRAGYGVVSGGAMGIDAEAHWAVIESHGQTLVFLGGGHRHLYPAKNRALFERILQNKLGALVSEYPPWQEVRNYQFPERNRLIAALGQKLFIAQAHAKSGSLHTARTAMDLGKEIYVLRPLSQDENFGGSIELIDSGARSLTQPKDLYLFD